MPVNNNNNNNNKTKSLVGDSTTTTTTSSSSSNEYSFDGDMEQNKQPSQEASPADQYITPLPMARSVNVASIPGAYSVSPTVAHQNNDNEGASLGPEPEQPPSPSQDMTGLAVAQMVVEDSRDLPLPQAEEIKGKESLSLSPADQQSYKYKAIGAAFLIIAAVLVPIIVFIVIPGMTSAKEKASMTLAPTSLYTQAPTTFQEATLSLLPQETITTILEDHASPQAQAFQWLLDDALLPHMFTDQIKQRFALATLYFATNGDAWANNQNWLDYGQHECNWYNKPDFAEKGIFGAIFPRYMPNMFPLTNNTPPNICDDNAKYRNLWLDSNNLAGSLPEELYLMMTSLETFSVGYNQLEGTISTRIGHMTNLVGLSIDALQTNGGTIPSEIGLLTSLRAFTSVNNDYQGTLPTEFWQLSRLQHLHFGRNPLLQFTIPTEIGMFSDLSWALVFSTELSGTIPTEIGNANSLEFLVLFESNLTGKIPTELGQLSDISMLSLHACLLSGTIPTELGQLGAMEFFAIRDNHQLSGPIPSELGRLTLTNHFGLRNQLLSGTIPTELGLITSLGDLTVSGNQLTGGIPSEFGQLTSLGNLNVANNTLSGTIPQELTPLWQSLHRLFLEGNPMLSGLVPEALCTLNGTCSTTVGSGGYSACDMLPSGLHFDCTSLLCGCGCSCNSSRRV